MKTAAKVFIIIGMIVGFWTVLPIIFGAIVLGKMSRNEVTTAWKVLTLIFVSIPGGIFLFCMPKEQPQVQGAAEYVPPEYQ